MPMPRLIVLTNAPAGVAPTEYLTDRDRFPAEPLFTTDLAMARTWAYPPGCRRWYKRHLAILPVLKDCRRVWVGEDVVEAARVKHKPHGRAIVNPADAGSMRIRAKLNPNKPSKGKPNKGARIKRRELKKLTRRAATSRPAKAAKVA